MIRGLTLNFRPLDTLKKSRGVFAILILEARESDGYGSQTPLQTIVFENCLGYALGDSGYKRLIKKERIGAKRSRTFRSRIKYNPESVDLRTRGGATDGVSQNAVGCQRELVRGLESQREPSFKLEQVECWQ